MPGILWIILCDNELFLEYHVNQHVPKAMMYLFMYVYINFFYFASKVLSPTCSTASRDTSLSPIWWWYSSANLNRWTAYESLCRPFVRENVLNGQTATDENIALATDRLIHNMQTDINDTAVSSYNLFIYFIFGK